MLEASIVSTRYYYIPVETVYKMKENCVIPVEFVEYECQSILDNLEHYTNGRDIFLRTIFLRAML